VCVCSIKHVPSILLPQLKVIEHTVFSTPRHCMKQTVQNLHMYTVKYSLYTECHYKAMLHFVTVISCENYSWQLDNRADIFPDQIPDLNIQHLKSNHIQTLPDWNF